MAKKLTKSKAKKILHDKEVHGHPLTEQQRKFFGAIAGGAKPYKAQAGVKTCPPGFVNIEGKCFDKASDEYKALYKYGIGYMDDEDTLVSSRMELPEVVLKPKSVLDFLDKIDLGTDANYGGGASRYAFDQLGKKYGFIPNVKILKEQQPSELEKLLFDIFDSSDKKRTLEKTAHYIPFIKTAYVDNIKEYIAELSHHVDPLVDNPGMFLITDIPAIINQQDRYKTKGTSEYRAHEEIEPKLKKDFEKYRGEYWDNVFRPMYFDTKNPLLRQERMDDVWNNYVSPVKKKKDGGWLDKYDNAPKAQNGIEGTMGGLTDVGFNYNGAWGGTMQNGGNLMPAMAGANQTVPMAQFGNLIKSEVSTSPLTNLISSLFTTDTKTTTLPKGKKPTLSTIAIKDPRTVRQTSGEKIDPKKDLLTGEYPTELLTDALVAAKKYGLSKDDLWNLAAMALQESHWGKTDSNLGHIKGDVGEGDTTNPFVNAYINKMKDADRLKITDPALRLQVYNGLGFIKPETEQDYHGFKMKKIYGVPVPKEGLSLKENPLYGKQIIDVRDNILKKNPEVVAYIESIDSKKFQMGGVLPGAVGFTYARTQSPAPANGPYAKKTKASAQNGQEMKYYQEGLDFKPKTISQNGSRTPIYVSNPNDRRLTRYNDSLILYNNYIRTKAAFDAALANPSSPKVPVDITPAKDKRYIRDRYRFEMSDGESTVSPLSTEEAVTAPQYETIFEGRKVSRPQVGTVNFPRHERYFSTSIDPINLIEYNNDLDYLLMSKDYTGDIESIKKTKLSNLEYIKNAKEREATLKQYPYILRPSKYNYYTSIEEYAKPVQPVVYKPDVKSYTLPTPKEPTLPKLYKYDPNTPTKFSFTYPTGGYNEQKTIYFPTRSAWKSYVEGIKGTEKFKSSQEGVDYAQATGYLQDGGDIPVDPMGYWNPENVGNPVTIPSNIITMEGVDQPLLGISDTGDVQYMEPGEDYEFDGEYVTEYPVAQGGKKVPIQTSDPADPRLHSYLDSLNLHKAYLAQRRINPQVSVRKFVEENLARILGSNKEKYIAKEQGRKKTFKSSSKAEQAKFFKPGQLDDAWTSEAKFKKDVPEDAPLIDAYKALTFSSPTETGLWTTPDLYNEKIAPVDIYFGGKGNAAYNPVFMEPVQPVEYTGNPADYMQYRSAPTIFGSKYKFKPKSKLTQKPVQPVEYRKPEDRRDTLYVPDINDPRLRAYQDSLAVYNSSKFIKEHPLTGNYIPGKEDERQVNINIDKKNVKKYNPKFATTYTGYYWDYKKPVQPVVYRPEPEVEYKPRPRVEAELPRTSTGDLSYNLPKAPAQPSKTKKITTQKDEPERTKKTPVKDFLEDMRLRMEDRKMERKTKRGIKSQLKCFSGVCYDNEGNIVQAKDGVSVNNADAQPLKKLDQLLNFTNYNKPTKGGWLDKYN